MFLEVGCILLIIAAIPYIIYFLGIRFGKKMEFLPPRDKFPEISLIISAYNEEKIIRERVRNILSGTYPRDRMQLIFINDCSSDMTGEYLKEALEHSGADYLIISNTDRMGTNRSYNNAIPKARHPIIITSDADVLFKGDALEVIVNRLCSDEKIAAVCGDQQPMEGQSHTFGQYEQAYRDYYGRMGEWESANDSTYNFNGQLVAFKKGIVSRINDKKGADDANTAFAAIRTGYRAVYEHRAVVFEDIPDKAGREYRQKTRRATRLIEATLANLDLLKLSRPFSRFFYPLRIWMYLVTPTLFFVGAVLFLIGLWMYSPLSLVVVAGILLAGTLISRKNLINAFVLNQFFLFRGLFNLGKDMRIWESTSKKT